VFRRGEALPDHLAEFRACPAPVVWFQLGIVNDAVAAALTAAGKQVVQDRCTLAEHRRLGLGAPRR
jgi:predicted CoA-binding protein